MSSAAACGYPENVVSIEYGVFIDRRDVGLGYTLMHICDSAEAAERMLDTIPTSTKPFIRQRKVTKTPWRPSKVGTSQVRLDPNIDPIF